MLRHIYMEVKGNFDARKLWELIECYGVNLLALEDKALVYGEVKLRDLGKLIQTCAFYGKLEATITGGGDYEQEGKEA